MLLTLSFNYTMACSFVPCPFCEILNEKPDDVILMGKISAIDDDGINLEVMEILRGEETRETVRIWDGTDFDCNGWHSMAADFMGQIGDTIVVILPKITEVENVWDVIGDYRRPFPYGSTPQLQFVSGLVKGFIHGDPFAPFEENTYEVEYSALKENFNDCSLLVDIEKVDGNLGVQINNPINTELIIRSDNMNEPLSIKVYSLGGKEIVRRDMYSNVANIDMMNIPEGMYLLKIEKRGKAILTKKILKI